MQKALRIQNLRQEAQELARSIGFGLTDLARDLFRLVPVQEYGDLRKIAEFFGVNRDVVYQWNSREGCSGVLEARSKARVVEKKYRRDLAKQQAAERQRQADERAMLAWREGQSASACTGRGSNGGAGRISRLRAKYGAEKVPYRKEGTIKTRRQRALIHASQISA